MILMLEICQIGRMGVTVAVFGSWEWFYIHIYSNILVYHADDIGANVANPMLDENSSIHNQKAHHFPTRRQRYDCDKCNIDRRLDYPERVHIRAYTEV